MIWVILSILASIWIVGAVVQGGAIGHAYKNNFAAGVFVGLIVGPLALLFVDWIPDMFHRCPYCRAALDTGAEMCPHCESWQPPMPRTIPIIETWRTTQHDED